MSLNIVSFKAPKFKPMPGELTPAVINGATLPVKVEAAKRAIAACCDLSELLTWKDKLAALAAAAKMARMPEMARDVNRVHKEAIFRMGEILLQYSSGSTTRAEVVKLKMPKRVRSYTTGKVHRIVAVEKGERAKIAEQLGISKTTVALSTRLVLKATAEQRKRILEDDAIGPTPARMVNCGRVAPTQAGKKKDSEAAAIFLRGYNPHNGTYAGRLGGLSPLATHLRGLDLDIIPQLTPEEKQRARKLVVEMQEILDDIDQRLGPDTSVKS